MKTIFIVIIVLSVLILLSSSVAIYIYIRNPLNINGTWLSSDAGSFKNAILFIDDNSSTISFKDAGAPSNILPRKMKVITRTSSLLEASYTDIFGTTITFSSTDGINGTYSTQKKGEKEIVKKSYKKTTEKLNVNGTWLSSGNETLKNTILFTDNGELNITFRDTSATSYIFPRPMNVISRTPTLFEAEYQGLSGDIIKFTSKDGNTGIYSVQKTSNEQPIVNTYQKVW
ncbi:hypothetical protein Indivirus_1_239 [Indivirus ILV1]|uniref:Uncharacterized protein n=1 Tax=Indivirus ILV1 TaxID=1977633 RepID=A0A1V0SD28_9VIRU|nr:hypothetical protein Indivirus_1_239 [Indivirus ILV1]